MPSTPRVAATPLSWSRSRSREWRCIPPVSPLSGNPVFLVLLFQRKRPDAESGVRVEIASPGGGTFGSTDTSPGRLLARGTFGVANARVRTSGLLSTRIFFNAPARRSQEITERPALLRQERRRRYLSRVYNFRGYYYWSLNVCRFYYVDSVLAHRD